jgi:RecJ-like exonuclease
LDKLIKLSANINNKGIEKFSKEDIEPDSLIKAYSDIKKFIQLAGDSVYEAIYENGLERLGTDIWFTRNGHGAGFFDHSYDDDDEKKLIQAGKSLGSVDLYINDNLKLSFSNQHLHEQSKQDIERELKLNEIKSLFKRHIGKL